MKRATVPSLCGQRATREPGDVRRRDVEPGEHPRRVVGEHFHGERAARHRSAARAAVVERSDAVAVGEPVELELPRLDGVAEAPDQQHVRPRADLLDVDVEVVGRDEAGRVRGDRHRCSPCPLCDCAQETT
jgi:hypothetical protein